MGYEKNNRANFEKLKSIVADCEDDADELFSAKDNKSAGKRLRQKIKQIQMLCPVIREEVKDQIKLPRK